MRFLLITTFFFSAMCSASIQEVKALHRAALSNHVYVTDMEQYGVNEKWVPSLVGDCEDYALWIQQALKQKGIIGDLWIVRTETDELHVVVVVGGMVVDNRYRQVKRKQDLPYKWIGSVEYYNAKNRSPD